MGLPNNRGCPFTQLIFEQAEQQRGQKRDVTYLKKQMQKNKFRFPRLGAISLVYSLVLIAVLWVCLFFVGDSFMMGVCKCEGSHRVVCD